MTFTAVPIEVTGIWFALTSEVLKKKKSDKIDKATFLKKIYIQQWKTMIPEKQAKKWDKADSFERL